MRSDHSNQGRSHCSEEPASIVSREVVSSNEHTFFNKSDQTKSVEKKMMLAGSDPFSSEENQGKMWIDSAKRVGTVSNVNTKVKSGLADAGLKSEATVGNVRPDRNPSCCTIS